jgi:hypothetical protein
MLSSSGGAVSMGVILVSTVYIAVRTPAIWHRYRGEYGRLLVSVPLAGLLFGLAHLGMLTPLSHSLFATIETGAILGIAAVIGAFGYIHPRLEYSGGEPQ